MTAIWAPGPVAPELQDGAVHVWLADLATLGEAPLALLDAGESARAKRFLQARDGQRWGQSHGVLRALLGSYLGVDGPGLRFSAGEHGKPELASTDDGPLPRLSFNLSHSGDLALYAISATAHVGIDLETPRSVERVLEIALRTFGPAESAQLEQLDPEARQDEFLRMWTRHEAELKCLGTGIGGAPLAAGAPRPWTRDLELGGRAVAAVAVEHQPSELCCWRWPSVARTETPP